MPIVDLDDYTPAQAREHWGYQLAQYTPPADSVIIDIDVDFVTRPITPPIHLVQFDKVLPVLAIHMYSNRSAYSMPQQSTAAIRVNNGNGTYYYAFAEGRSADFTTVYFQIQAALCLDPGFKPGVIEISNSDGLVNSSSIQIEVEQNPVPEDAIISSDDYINLRQLIDEVEKWAYGDCQHLTNNSWIVKGCKEGVQIGTGATAEGAENTSTGAYSHTEGYNNTASGAKAHAEGTGTTASAEAAHTEGNGSVASATAAHAEGLNSSATGAEAHAEGNATTASGLGSHAEGEQSTASGEASHAEGASSVASGPCSHAEGWWTKAENIDGLTPAQTAGSHAEGFATLARGVGAHAEGYGVSGNDDSKWVRATSSGAHAEGHSTQANADCAHAEGWFTKANGAYSHASGYNTIAGYESQFVCGQFNENDQDNIFEIGTGEDAENRSNAFSVSRSGVVTMGSVTSTAIANAIRALGTQVYSPRTGMSGTRREQYGGVVTLRPTANIPKGESGTFTGTYTVNIATAEWADFKGNKISRDSGNKPLYHPLFVTTKIQNEQTLTNRRILEVGTTFSIGELNADQTSFEVTVTTNVINFSDTTAVDATNVIIEKEIWCLMSGYYDE